MTEKLSVCIGFVSQSLYGILSKEIYHNKLTQDQ